MQRRPVERQLTQIIARGIIHRIAGIVGLAGVAGDVVKASAASQCPGAGQAHPVSRAAVAQNQRLVLIDQIGKNRQLANLGR